MMNPAKLADLIAVLPLIVLFIGSLIPITLKTLIGNKEPKSIFVLIQGGTAIIGSIILSITVYHFLNGVEFVTQEGIFNKLIVLDKLSVISTVPILLISFFILAIIRENPTTQGKGYAEITFLFLSSLIGMLILISAINFLTMFVALEVMSLPIYIMIGMGHDNRDSKESALKYFILGSFASGIFLMGASLIYGSSGTLSLEILKNMGKETLLNHQLFAVGIIFVLVGFFFKVSIVPFHAWTVDVYQGAPTPLTAFMAISVKLATVVAFMRFIELGYFVTHQKLLDLLQWIAAFTILVGNGGALLQNSLKRILGYSSIAHSGYLMLGLVSLGVAQDTQIDSIKNNILFYLVGYGLMSLGALSFISYLEQKEGAQLSIKNLSGYFKHKPIFALALSILLLSLGGIPPFIGFFAKIYLFVHALDQGFLWLTIWAAIGSIIGIYYYLRPVVAMYMENSSGSELSIETNPKSITQIVVLTSALLVLIIGIFNDILLKLLSVIH